MSDSTSGASGVAGANSDKTLTDAVAAALSSDAKASPIDATLIDSPGVAPEPDAHAKAAAKPTVGRLMIMAPPQRDWSDMRVKPEAVIDHEVKTPKAASRKVSTMAAMLALAAITGALGGAAATAGLSYGSRASEQTAAASHVRALDDTIMRIEADLASLKTNVDKVAKANITQASKATDRFDKLEKAQADPAARIAKLTETVEKLRVAAATPPSAPTPAPVAAAPAPAREVTGSIQPPAAAPAKPEKPEIARLPVVEGWVLRDVERGGAMIEGRQGVFEVYAGDPVPGLGRVDAIRRQDGRWVVVTSKGLIVGR